MIANCQVDDCQKRLLEAEITRLRNENSELAARVLGVAQARPDCGAMRAQWTYDPEVHAYYFAPLQAAAPPYNTREVTAIIDIANDGTLAGVELIDNMPPPPSPLSSTHQSAPQVSLSQHAEHQPKGDPAACGADTAMSSTSRDTP